MAETDPTNPLKMPTTQDISPISYDPMLSAIRIAKETGVQMSQIPNPVLQLVGNAMTTVANQHEALHMSLMGAMKIRNFVQQGGIQALNAEMEKVLPPALQQFKLPEVEVSEALPELPPKEA